MSSGAPLGEVRYLLFTQRADPLSCRWWGPECGAEVALRPYRPVVVVAPRCVASPIVRAVVTSGVGDKVCRNPWCLAGPAYVAVLEVLVGATWADPFAVLQRGVHLLFMTYVVGSRQEGHSVVGERRDRCRVHLGGVCC